MDCSPPGSSVLVISQVRILEWVAISFSRESSQPRDQTCVSCLADTFFTTEPPGKPMGTYACLYNKISKFSTTCTLLCVQEKKIFEGRRIHCILISKDLMLRTQYWRKEYLNQNSIDSLLISDLPPPPRPTLPKRKNLCLGPGESGEAREGRRKLKSAHVSW